MSYKIIPGYIFGIFVAVGSLNGSNSRGGSRASPRRGRQSLGGHQPNILIIFSENPMKSKKFWSVGGGGAGGAPLNPPLNSAILRKMVTSAPVCVSESTASQRPFCVAANTAVSLFEVSHTQYVHQLLLLLTAEASLHKIQINSCLYKHLKYPHTQYSQYFLLVQTAQVSPYSTFTSAPVCTNTSSIPILNIHISFCLCKHLKYPHTQYCRVPFYRAAVGYTIPRLRASQGSNLGRSQ